MPNSALGTERAGAGPGGGGGEAWVPRPGMRPAGRGPDIRKARAKRPAHRGPGP